MDLSGWSNFFLAQVGASAALAGLLFVGISINLTKILATSALPNRALQALVFLLTVLVISSLLLMPSQQQPVVGIEVLIVAAIMWWIGLRLDLHSLRHAEMPFRPLIVTNFALDQIITLLYAAAGISILIWGSGGLYLLAPAALLSILKAMSDAWVLLIEINR